MSKALIVASVASMIDQFNRHNIELLKELGFDVHIACNFVEGSTCSFEKIQQLKIDLQSEGVTFSQIDFARNITRISQNYRAYKQIKQLLQQEKYDLINCHSPIGGLLTRMAAKKYRKKGTRVIYTAHGFHFFKGAPLKNWLLYYPVEWLCAYWTDVLITINKEDYALAKKHMHAKRVEYVPGVGIDLQKFAPDRLSQEERNCLRESIGVGKEDKLLLSVGELIRRKNHESVIRALAELDDQKLKYRICGCGELKSYLQNLIDELHLTDRVQLLGYRNDISELCECADLFIFPSFQEGLPVALMEAIASKTPVICSDIRGNTDLVGQQELFNCTDTDGIAKKIRESLQKDHTEEIERNYRCLKRFDLAAVIPDMKAIYSNRGGVIRHLYEIYKQQNLRESIGIPVGAVFLLSVGELNDNKNHGIVIRAIAELQNPNIHYAIAGTGELRGKLLNLAAELGVADRVHLLGFRSDVVELYRAADLFIHPSKREGLPVALMEAIASKVPVICSNVRGNNDLIQRTDALFECNDKYAVCERIKKRLDCNCLDEVNDNYFAILNYSLENIVPKMKKIYGEI